MSCFTRWAVLVAGLALLTGGSVAAKKDPKREAKRASAKASGKAAGKSGPEPCRAPIRLERTHSGLQKALARALRKKGWQRYVDKKLLGVSVVDLSDPKRIYYAGINDDHMMYAASLPKIAILLAVVEAAHQGTVEWNHVFDKRLQNMIVASSNPDASWGTDLVGLLAIEKVLRDPRYCFYREPKGGLWVGRAYRSGGASNRDPLFNISHGSTSRQAVRFFTMLNQGKLVTPHWSFRMLGLMSPPAHHHKFVGALGKRPGVVFLARKSGTWRNFHSDGALIQHFDNRFALVVLSELKYGEQILREIAVIVDDLIMEGAHRKGRRRSMVRK